jgi:hypothetical protein
VAWQRRPLRAGGTLGIYYARSLDVGASFAAPVLVSNGARHANNPRLAVGSAALDLVWSESVAGDDQFHVTDRSSPDFGESWESARRLSTSARYGGWPAIAAAGPSATAVWQDDRDKLLLADGATPAIDRQHNFEIYAVALPEPSLALLLAAGLPALAACQRFRTRR